MAAYRWEAGEAGRCLYVSPQIESMLGFSPEQWMGDVDLWLARMHPDDRARVMNEEERGQAEAACSTTSIACCMPTGTSCGCGSGALGRR